MQVKSKDMVKIRCVQKFDFWGTLFGIIGVFSYKLYIVDLKENSQLLPMR